MVKNTLPKTKKPTPSPSKPPSKSTSQTRSSKWVSQPDPILESDSEGTNDKVSGGINTSGIFDPPMLHLLNFQKRAILQGRRAIVDLKWPHY